MPMGFRLEEEKSSVMTVRIRVLCSVAIFALNRTIQTGWLESRCSISSEQLLLNAIEVCIPGLLGLSNLRTPVD